MTLHGDKRKWIALAFVASVSLYLFMGYPSDSVKNVPSPTISLQSGRVVSLEGVDRRRGLRFVSRRDPPRELILSDEAAVGSEIELRCSSLSPMNRPLPQDAVRTVFKARLQRFEGVARTKLPDIDGDGWRRCSVLNIKHLGRSWRLALLNDDLTVRVAERESTLESVHGSNGNLELQLHIAGRSQRRSFTTRAPVLSEVLVFSKESALLLRTKRLDRRTNLFFNCKPTDGRNCTTLFGTSFSVGENALAATISFRLSTVGNGSDSANQRCATLGVKKAVRTGICAVRYRTPLLQSPLRDLLEPGSLQKIKANPSPTEQPGVTPTMAFSPTLGPTVSPTLSATHTPTNGPQLSQTIAPTTTQTATPTSAAMATRTATPSVTPTRVPLPLSVSCAPVVSSIVLGETAQWRSSVSGGSGNYSYAWSGPSGLAGTQDRVNFEYTSAGQYRAALTVRSGDVSKRVDCDGSITVTIAESVVPDLTRTKFVPLETFDTLDGVSKWTVNKGLEYPGSDATLVLGAGRTGKGARMNYSIGGTGHYVAARYVLPSPQSGKYISFWIRSSASERTFIRFKDSTGQTFQYASTPSLQAARDMSQWRNEIYSLGRAPLWWGGAGDGVFHFPLKEIEIGVVPYFKGQNGQSISGNIELDDISLIGESGIGERIDPRKQPVVEISPDSIPASFGLLTHGSSFNEKGYSRVAELGIKIIRADLSWAVVEQKKGVYNFSWYGRAVDRMNGVGAKALLILNYTNSLYPLTGTNLKAENPLKNVSEENFDAFVNGFGEYAKAAAKFFKDKDVIFEVWNEPNVGLFKDPATGGAKYAELSKRAIAKIREADPDAYVMAGSLTSVNTESFLTQLINAGGLDGANAISWHPYTSYPEDVTRLYLFLKETIRRKLPPGIELVNSEWGYSATTYLPNANNDIEIARILQAQFVARQFLSSFSVGFPYNIYYGSIDDGNNINDTEMNFGLHHNTTFELKPAGVAVKFLREMTKDKIVKGLLKTENGRLHVLKLENNSETMLIAWTSFGKEPVTLSFQDKPIAVQDTLGKQISVLTTGSAYGVTIGSGPVYIRLKN